MLLYFLLFKKLTTATSQRRDLSFDAFVVIQCFVVDRAAVLAVLLFSLLSDDKITGHTQLNLETSEVNQIDLELLLEFFMSN